MDKQIDIPFPLEKHLEDIPNFEEKAKLHDAFLAYQKLVKKGLNMESRVLAESIVREFNENYGPDLASYEYSSWQGIGGRGGYRINFKLPDSALYRDILDENGNRLPSLAKK